MNYYRRFMGDYASKTADLSLAEHGAYTLMLDISYSTEAGLPASYDALFRLCRAMSKVEQDAVKMVADRFFPVCADGLRRNPRAADEITKAQATIAKQRQSGADSAAKRWSTNAATDNSEDRSTDRSTHESTDRSIDPAAIQPPTSNHQPLTTNPKTKAKAPRSAKRPLPEDFGISPRVLQWAAAKGFDRLEQHLESFRLKCAAKGYQNIDWDAAFMEAIREDWAKLRAGRTVPDNALRADL